jgi:hypothetical protein
MPGTRWEIMTLRRRRGGSDRHPGAAPRAAVPSLAAVALLTALVAALWVGPAASASIRHSGPKASHSGEPTGLGASRPASPHPGWVKYFIVAPPNHGHKEFLFQIAVITLGKGTLYPEIVKLNKGRLQPDGGRLENPMTIEPGWILVLPPNASGPGVHYGPLPVVHPLPPKSSATAPHAPVTAPARVGTKTAIAGGTSLAALLLIAGLGIVVRQRRKARGRQQAGGAGPPASPAAPEMLPVGGRPELDAPRPALDSPADSPIPLMAAPAPDTPVAPGFLQFPDQPAAPNWPDYLMPGGSRPTVPAAPDQTGIPGPVMPAPAMTDGPAAWAAPVADPVADPAVQADADPAVRRHDPTGGQVAAADATASTALSPAALRILGAQRSSARLAEIADMPTQEHQVALGGDWIRIVLTEAPAARTPAAGREGQARNGHTWLTSAPYLVWTPLPYDTPDGGIAFACLGAGDEGCLFIDLAAAPGTVSIGGDSAAAARLAESLAHQLCAASAAGSTAATVVVGDVLPEPRPAGATWVASLHELEGMPAAPGPNASTEILFCRLHSNEDVFPLARYVSRASRHVVPVVLASLPDAPWSFTAQPSRHPAEGLRSVHA